MIHGPNTAVWKCGDYVMHDSDAKRADMLVVVVGRDKDVIYRTRYA
jgi:hypothetical protein